MSNRVKLKSMKKIYEDYRTRVHTAEWFPKVKEMLEVEARRYRSRNCKGFVSGFTRKGRDEYQQCVVRSKIYASALALKFLNTVTPQDEREKKQLETAINTLKQHIDDYNNVTLF